MTGCCVPLCTGSWKKGLRTFRFPRDPERRKKWEAQVKREKWKATDTSKICERHFEPDQYENARQDWRRLLKSTAVPTLFDFRPQPKCRKPPVRRRSLADSATSATESFQSTDIASPGPSSPNDQELDTGKLCISDSTEEEEQEEHCDILDVDSLSTSEMRKALRDMQKKNSQLKESLSVAKKKMRTATRQAAKLETKVTMLTANLNYLNEDQKTALERQDRTCRTWSADTVKKALQLKFACGGTGYDLLIEQGYPLPSRRTLCRRLQHLSFKPGVLHEILSAM
ncbi:THAP domain-containing protein 1-like [Dermacentor albipictus]|uniref:THAP domain-containing protein 1-like n=1 Tax=Dermacentor albipictus TaxID=60249 RepID=UPI0031FC243D